MKKSLFFGNGSLTSCILRFICPSKPIGKKYLNRPKYHKLENLVLIAESENIIRINSGVSSVCTFLHADFEGDELYTARLYVNFTKEGREEELFVNEEEEEEDEVLSVSLTPLVVEQRVDGAEISDLPCLDLKKNPNVTSDNMAGIRRQ